MAAKFDPARLNSAVWGFAEATLVFLVPDILLTRLAISDLRLALAACGFALLGALVGGCVMYGWGAADASSALAVVERVPAVSPAVVDRVGRSLEGGGLWPIFVGPLAGIPYKIYATQAGALGLSLALFLLASIPARGFRFVALTLFAAGVSAAIGRRLDLRGKRLLHLALWTTFYAWYLALTPN